MGIKYLPRRVFLKGLGATWLGLPLLEVMLDSNGEALAQTGGALPSRYVVTFCGLSTGSGGNYATGEVLNDHFAPNNVGLNYDLKTALKPLAKYNVQNEVSVCSNMLLPSRLAAEAFGPGPGAFQGGFHVVAHEALITGMRTQSRSPGAPYTYTFAGESSDQVVARMQASKGYTGIPSLNYRIQASSYLNSGQSSQSISRKIVNGASVVVGQESSPRLAYNRLITNFKDSNPAAEAIRKAELAKRKSVLDLVAEQLKHYQSRLPASDQKTLSDWSDHVRTIENDITRLDQVEGGQCIKMADPGNDPPKGSTVVYKSGEPIVYQQNDGYSNEVLRGSIFNDLIRMAFACDMSRVATIMITIPQCHMNAFPTSQFIGSCHEMTHGGAGAGNNGYSKLSLFHAWNVDFFAQLVKKLKDTKDGAGTLIDSSALVHLNEGGLGKSTESVSKNLLELTPHSGDNYSCLVAGRAGGLKSGQHVRTNKVHPCKALISAMKSVGVTGDKLGEVSGIVPELFG